MVTFIRKIVTVSVWALMGLQVANAALIGEWTFDEGSGTVASNSASTGSLYDGTINGTPAFVTGHDGTGYALDMNGVTGNNVSLADVSLLAAVTNEISIAFWAYGNTNQPVGNIVFQGAPGRTLQSHLPWPASTVYWDVANSSNTRQKFTAAEALWKGNWTLWVMTKNAAEGTQKVYANGELLNTATGLYEAIGSVTSFAMGADVNGENAYPGIIDDFQIYDHELSISEIADLYNPPPADAALIAHWTFDETSGTTAADETGHFDGTVFGSATWTNGLYGGALAFGDDTGTFVDVPAEAFSNISKQVSIALWTYGADYLDAEGNTCSGFGANDRKLNSHLPWNDGSIYWDCGGARHSFKPGAAYYKNAWNHYIFTKNADTGEAKVYINGEERGSWTGDTNLISGITQFRIGRDVGSNYYDGLLDEVRLYNYVLTDDEIFTLSRSPSHIEAEEYTSHSGTETDAVEDVGGGEYIGWIDDGDWAEYTIDIETPGLHRIDFRVASDGGDGSIYLSCGGSTIGSVYVGDTGGWQVWETKSIYVDFTSAGYQTLRLNFDVPSGGFNINWFSYTLFTGDPVIVTVGSTRQQMMRYGLDYERLWYWKSSMADQVADWSVNDCNIDYIRTAMNSAYELEEGTYTLSAYTSKIIPMMTAMQQANPHIKWFATPRPLNEAVSNASWQPYPLWVTGASSYTAGDYDFNATKCAEYMIKYLLLMKSYGFKITYMDLTNEWQDNYASGGKISPDDVVTIKQVFDAYLENPWPHPALDSSILLEADDFPLMIGASSWNYSQGATWISKFTTSERQAAIDIASSHNTDKTGTAQNFADQVHATLGANTEVWETEQHGWKGNSSTSEAMSFSYMIESIRAGFTGLSGWLAIGTTSQGHSYLLNANGTVTRNVKYYMFKKLSTTSNYGYALDMDQTDDLTSTMALIRDNLLTLWVINTSSSAVLAEFDLGAHEWDGTDIISTRWDEDLSIDGDETPEGIEGAPLETSSSTFTAVVNGRATYCFEIPLVNNEDNFPFVQAEAYDSGSGVTISGDSVGFDAAGSEIAFDLDIVKTYPHDVAFRVSSETAHIAFEIYDGDTLIGSVDRMATGGAQQWTTLYKTVSLDGGPMNLRIVALNGGWNLDWIKFDKEFFESDVVLENLALGQTYSASNVYGSGYEADKAFDGDRGSRWATSETPVWLEVDFGTPTMLNGFSMYEYGDRTSAFEIQYSDDGVTWHTAYTGGNPEDDTVYYFPEVTATKFRYQSISSSGGPSIYELEFYYNPNAATSNPNVVMATQENSISLAWSGMEGATYTLQQSTNLVEGFTTIESGIPVHEATNVNTMATAEDEGFYRVILEK